jgi:selenocysteine lyase/cysteine desulfurase
MKNFSKIFPVLNQYTYLNTAASGLLSTPVLEWRQEHDLDFLVMGSKLKEEQGKVLSAVREKVGKLFSCAPNRVALVPNFSYGMNTLLEGIASTEKVLLLEGDYPSVNWPFVARGFTVSYAQIDAKLEENVRTAFAKAQPDIFAFSLVQWVNGIKMNHAFLRQLKTDYPNTLFIADGTQYVGTEVFDFENSGLDVLGASTYKWMNAGYGNALFLFKEEVAKRVAPKTTGFNSIQGKYKPQEGNFLGHFEPGHQDTLNFGSLGAAIDLIHQIGMSTIQERIETLAKIAKAAFVERGLLEASVVDRSLHSSIFNLKGDQALIDRLEEQGILCIARGTGVRVSFHYFNTEKDLETLLAVLDLN